jgi:cell growth-regulating nucleolar protein
MTEDQKYQGALYKPKKQKSSHPQPQSTSEPESKMPQRAYVEDVTEEYEAYREYEIHDSDDDDGKSTGDLPPEAPTPPAAVDTNVNVFDFLVAATPNTSNLNLGPSTAVEISESRQLVRFDHDADGYVDQSGYAVDEEDMIHYGTGPIHAQVHFETPAPKGERRRTKDPERELKKDKKRKRLHIETNSPLAIDNGPTDLVMTDAPPELPHSGLTGGLNRLMRPSVFPPSPDYSGGDGGENSPASPIKKSKHSKTSKPSRTEAFGNNLRALMSGTSKTTTKVSKKRKHSSERKEKKRHHHEKAPKLIEYRPQSSDGKDEEGQLVVFKPRSELFLNMCTKGPESERGYSMNKALKRFHRERTSSGSGLGKVMEEKELWRSLRMRRNSRGEIVLFSV